MNKQNAAPNYKRHRFPPEIIGHAVWLYFRFALSYRDVEELLAERGVLVTYESIRCWSRKFGQTYANALRRRRPRPGDKWHLDEVFIRISGTTLCWPFTLSVASCWQSRCESARIWARAD